MFQGPSKKYVSNAGKQRAICKTSWCKMWKEKNYWNLFSLNLCVSSITFLRLSISSSLVSLGIKFYIAEKIIILKKLHQRHWWCVFNFSLGCNDCIKCELHKYDLCFTCSLQPVSPPFPVQACTLYILQPSQLGQANDSIWIRDGYRNPNPLKNKMRLPESESEWNWIFVLYQWQKSGEKSIGCIDFEKLCRFPFLYFFII